MFTLSWESEDPGLFTWKQTNMEQTERDQLLGSKERLEERIAKHQDIVDQTLKDEGPKLANWRENLKKVQDLVDQLKKDLAEVERKLSQHPAIPEGWAVFPRPLYGRYPSTIYETEAEAEEALAKMGVGYEVRRARWVEASGRQVAHAEPDTTGGGYVKV